MINFYRNYYLKIKKSNLKNKEELLKKITVIASLYKKNKKFGSKEKGGNGICHECHLEFARKSHWNCKKCSGIKNEKAISHSLEEMQNSLARMQQQVRQKKIKTDDSMEKYDKNYQKIAESVFIS